MHHLTLRKKDGNKRAGPFFFHQFSDNCRGHYWQIVVTFLLPCRCSLIWTKLIHPVQLRCGSSKYSCASASCRPGATVAFRADKDPRLIQPPKTGAKAWIISATWLRTFATVVFLGPVLYHSDRFLARGWHRISEGLEIPMAFITVAVPLTVVIIFVHLIARLIGSDTARPTDLNWNRLILQLSLFRWNVKVQPLRH